MAGSWQLLGELAVHHHDRSDVLDGGREPQLTHELGAALGVLEHGAADEQQPRHRDEQHQDDAEQAERDHSSGATASFPSTVAGDEVDSNATLTEPPGDEHAAHRGRRHHTDLVPRRDERRSPRGERDDHTERGTDSDPGDRVARESERGQRSHTAPGPMPVNSTSPRLPEPPRIGKDRPLGSPAPAARG